MKALYIATCHLREYHYAKFHDQNPIVEITGRCLYRNGEYSIYKLQERAYYFLWKNVIVGTFTGINKELAELLVSGEKPKEYPQKYNYEEALSGIKEAPKWAEKYGFEIR